MAISSQALVSIFNQLFRLREKTILEGGGKEPEYLPANKEQLFHRIIFTRDYAASALHEISHWCIAGPQRRLQTDYGYWYVPDGRNTLEQRSFEQVEVRPQALEWVFSRAAGSAFQISADNLETDAGASKNFKYSVVRQAKYYCETGLPARARLFAEALQKLGGCDSYLNPRQYRLVDIA